MGDILLDAVEERGRQQGIEQSRLESIRCLMESYGVAEDKAMEALKIPADERPRYLEILNQKETI